MISFAFGSNREVSMMATNDLRSVSKSSAVVSNSSTRVSLKASLADSRPKCRSTGCPAASSRVKTWSDDLIHTLRHLTKPEI
ncbi:unnamed protein product [Oppiella nova]|uniref:Uncharacterized protein n=1 Tax=Oppiella nova TaxID=334625 RepID=A0A7R9M2R2_9ACAR|nr:unnamed protein product [Oppiella nova]CAG2169133.1 unnamed protein product [Oppiella nova]